MTLVEFLLARIAEDEAVARSVDEHLLRSLRSIARDAPLPGGEVLHIVRWDPARVLVECEAKRNLVRYAAFMLKAWEDKPKGAYPDMNRRERHTARLILETLGSVYSDHPDYQPEWAV